MQRNRHIVRCSLYVCITFLLGLLVTQTVQAQQTITGTVSNRDSKDPLIGAKVLVRGTTAGGLTDEKGAFKFVSPKPAPVDIVITYLGYDTLIQTVTNFSGPLRFLLEERAIQVEEVEITATGISERQKQSPLSIESMSISAIKETPSISFYDGLGSLKGVDLTAASLGFKIINTRGFNSTSPVRTLQIIDGVDNQAPGLNFSLGNFLGSSDLDVEQVELVVGASSAFYGPNAFNGVISMKTKSPFIHKGLSVSLKAGERSFGEVALRYAHAFKNKAGKDSWAFKLNAYYLTADDWEADNLDPVDESSVPASNPGRFDAVNRYGDENLSSGINNATSKGEQVTFPGLGRWYRTGYEEVDLVDYDTRNLKLAGAIHFKVRPEVELILSSSFGTGTTVYQGDNRYSLKDILFYQNRIELRKENKFFLRAYATNEDAGNSYDAVFTAFRLQELSRSDNDWSVAYRNYWGGSVPPTNPLFVRGGMVNRVRALEGFPKLGPAPDFFFDFNKANQILLANQDSLSRWHELAQNFADNGGPSPRLVPGTPAFTEAFNKITSTPLREGGTRLVDRSALYHVHGEYLFDLNPFKLTLGGNGRLYKPVSDGNIFSDTADIKIENFEFGLYGGLERNIWDDKIKLNATLRLDKNQNFDPILSPALSAVWNIDDNNILRASFASAIRNPTLADQYLYYNVGRAILLGNLNGIDNLVDTASLRNYFNSTNLDISLLKYFDIDPIQPEKVQTLEMGYRTTLFKRMYVDMSYYFSRYKDFIGYNVGVDIVLDPLLNRVLSAQGYRVAANARDIVTTQGYSIGANYYFDNGLALNGNYSWNKLNTQSDDPIIPAFNTPEHKYNLGVSGRNLQIQGLREWGFNVNYKWIQGFTFEGSPQFTGKIPSYDLLDAQINRRIPNLKSTIKIGASNVLNKKQFQAYGGPRIGRMAYFSITTDIPNL